MRHPRAQFSPQPPQALQVVRQPRGDLQVLRLAFGDEFAQADTAPSRLAPPLEVMVFPLSVTTGTPSQRELQVVVPPVYG